MPQYCEMNTAVPEQNPKNTSVSIQLHCPAMPTADSATSPKPPIITVSMSENEEISRFCSAIGRAKRIVCPQNGRSPR